MNVDGLRKDVWNGLLDAALATRYYQQLADRYHRIHIGLRVTTAASAFGILSPILFAVPEAIAEVLSIVGGIVVAGCVLADLIGTYADKAALLHQVGVECGKAEDAWRILWLQNDDQSADTAELERRYQELLGQDPTEAAGKIPERKGLTKKCWKEALTVETHRYAA